MTASAQRKRLLSAVVGTDQDFEFYPTTDQIIAAINHDMGCFFKQRREFPRHLIALIVIMSLRLGD